MFKTKRNSEKIAKRLVLCLDGTWNSPHDTVKRRDRHEVLKPTNVLKVCRAVKPGADDGKSLQVAYYAIGVGSLAEYPGIANSLLRKMDRFLGGTYGAGFEANVEAALHFLELNYSEGDEVFIFGFSRGAATARAVTRFLDWNGGLPRKEDAYYLPLLFKAYVEERGVRDASATIASINRRRSRERRALPPLQAFVPVHVTYLGVWDTVMALGSRFQATSQSTSASDKSFYVGPAPAKCVDHARQALAVDEARNDFRPEIWLHSAPEHPAQRLEQRWFPGVHSNIGGGYRHDGLANIAFRWILDGAVDHGLSVDKKYVEFYRPYVEDSLYESSSWLYKLGDWIRLQNGRGIRKLVDFPPSANLTLDPAVMQRMLIPPGRLRGADDLRPGSIYRPDNVMEYLACQPDPEAMLQDLNLGGLEPKSLPADVRQRIQDIRAERTLEMRTCSPMMSRPVSDR